MTRTELARLLRTQTGSDAVAPGYNHAIFSIRVPRDMVAFTAEILKNRKADIEAAYREKSGVADWTLLDHVCLKRPRSVVVAVPFDTSLGQLEEVLSPMLAGTGSQLPCWS